MGNENHSYDKESHESYLTYMKYTLIFIILFIICIYSYKAIGSTIADLFGPIAALGKEASDLINDCSKNGITHCFLGISLIIGLSLYGVQMLAVAYRAIAGGKEGIIDTSALELLTNKNKTDIAKEFSENYSDKLVDEKMKEKGIDPKFKDSFTAALAAYDVKKQSIEALEKSGLSPENMTNRKNAIQEIFDKNIKEASDKAGNEDDFNKIDENAKEIVGE
jgi:hypothetical protein